MHYNLKYGGDLESACKYYLYRITNHRSQIGEGKFHNVDKNNNLLIGDLLCYIGSIIGTVGNTNMKY